MQRVQITFDAEGSFGHALSGKNESSRGYMAWTVRCVLAALALVACGDARETFAMERALIERLGLLAK